MITPTFSEVEFTHEKFHIAKVDLHIPTVCGLNDSEMSSTK